MSKFAKSNSFKKLNDLLFKNSPGNLLIIFYQLTKFEAGRCYSFPDISSCKFQWPNLQKAIIKKK